MDGPNGHASRPVARSAAGGNVVRNPYAKPVGEQKNPYAKPAATVKPKAKNVAAAQDGAAQHGVANPNEKKASSSKPRNPYQKSPSNAANPPKNPYDKPAVAAAAAKPNSDNGPATGPAVARKQRRTIQSFMVPNASSAVKRGSKKRSSSAPNASSLSNNPSATSVSTATKKPRIASDEFQRSGPENSRPNSPRKSPNKRKERDDDVDGSDDGEGSRKRVNRGKGARKKLSFVTCTAASASGRGCGSNETLQFIVQATSHLKWRSLGELKTVEGLIFSNFVPSWAKNCGRPVPTIPVADFTPITGKHDELQLLLESGIASAPGVDPVTIGRLAMLVDACIYWQSDKSALRGVTSQTHSILSCPIHTQNTLLQREDIFDGVFGVSSTTHRLP